MGTNLRQRSLDLRRLLRARRRRLHFLAEILAGVRRRLLFVYRSRFVEENFWPLLGAIAWAAAVALGWWMGGTRWGRHLLAIGVGGLGQ